MDSYTYSNARKYFSKVLNTAYKQGQVKITRRDGKCFIIKPEFKKTSPLDIKGINIKGLTKTDILDSIKEGRKKF